MNIWSSQRLFYIGQFSRIIQYYGRKYVHETR